MCVRLAFLSVWTRYCPGSGREGIRTGQDVLSDLQVRLQQRPRLNPAVVCASAPRRMSRGELLHKAQLALTSRMEQELLLEEFLPRIGIPA